MKNEIVLFESGDNAVRLEVPVGQDTVWLTQEQMSLLFNTARSSVAYHIGKIFKEGELLQDTSVEIFDRSSGNAFRPAQYYNLDVIISVGYRVKSQRGIEFRRWANNVLKQYLLQGYAASQRRLAQLGKALRLVQRTGDLLDNQQLLSVIGRYGRALTLLDAYDHHTLQRPAGRASTYVLTYEECRALIDSMRFGRESDLFGHEKDDSFKGSIGNIYQSFGGQEIYPTLEEKAANLLYFVTKNHSFSDGNKRIAASLFLHFLDKNGVLFHDDGEKLIDDHTLAALTIMVAESRPAEKETMVSVIMNCIAPE